MFCRMKEPQKWLEHERKQSLLFRDTSSNVLKQITDFWGSFRVAMQLPSWSWMRSFEMKNKLILWLVLEKFLFWAGWAVFSHFSAMWSLFQQIIQSATHCHTIRYVTCKKASTPTYVYSLVLKYPLSIPFFSILQFIISAKAHWCGAGGSGCVNSLLNT